MASALLEVQEAAVQLLTADSQLASMLAKDSSDPAGVRPGVFDSGIPEDQGFPYLVVGEGMTEDPHPTYTTDVQEVMLDVHAWSLYTGLMEAEQLAARIYIVLHKAALPLPTLHLAGCRHFHTNVLTDPDGRVRHALIRFRVFAE